MSSRQGRCPLALDGITKAYVRELIETYYDKTGDRDVFKGFSSSTFQKH